MLPKGTSMFVPCWGEQVGITSGATWPG
jgi:hypothetical protein